MSGGKFNYDQHRITYIADEIENVIHKNGKKKTDKELKEEMRSIYWYQQYPEDKFHYKYPKEVIEEFKKGVELLRKAQVYAQRIDFLLSGDDSEESFLERLKEDLDKID